MPSGTSRARYRALAGAKDQLPEIAAKLRAEGKDATPTAVVRHITQGDKAEHRKRFIETHALNVKEIDWHGA